MLRENKRKLFLSSAVILLPVLFGLIVWNRLPGTLITHWGADGKADGSAAKALAVFGLPLAHLLVHLLCLCLTLRDPKQQRQSPRALGMVFWILPVCSLVTSGMMYRAALGKEPEAPVILPPGDPTAPGTQVPPHIETPGQTPHPDTGSTPQGVPMTDGTPAACRQKNAQEFLAGKVPGVMAQYAPGLFSTLQHTHSAHPAPDEDADAVQQLVEWRENAPYG